MSWYRDPQLFIYWSSYYGKFRVLRIHKHYSVTNPIQEEEYYSGIEDLNFSKHLSLGNNKETDFEHLKSIFPANSGGDFKYINCQGLVVNWIERIKMGIWSREELDSVFYSLPGLPLTGPGARLLAEKRALEDKVSAMQANLSNLQYEVNRSKAEKEVEAKTISDLQAGKQSLSKTVSDLQAENSFLKDEVKKEKDENSALASKLKECCGAEGEEPWTGGDTVPSNWVPFEDLDVQIFGRNIPLTITKAVGATKISEDKTTNVRGNRFYRGVFPLVLVNVDELIPGEKARFDPEFWGSYNNKAGIRYAARKLLDSELKVDAGKTC